MKLLKYINFGLVSTFIFTLFNTNVYAKNMTPDEIKGSSYVIGSHVFTREINENTGYKGRLTTDLIMLAAQTIESNDLDSMIIYYKTASGMWINGLTGLPIDVPGSFNIDYNNMQLEEINSTVEVPKAPILVLDGPLLMDDETDMMLYQLNIFIDDIDYKLNKVDGVELSMLDYKSHIISQDLKYNENFDVITTVQNNYTGNDLIIGKQYHSDFITIENTPNGNYTINARAYVLDGNNKKTYSDWVSIKLHEDGIEKVQLFNDCTNPNYLSFDGEHYVYKLGIKQPEAYMFKIQPDKFAYKISYTREDNVNTNVGIFKLDEPFTDTIPKNSVRTYHGSVGYYDLDGNFNSIFPIEEFTIDTRTLTTPILDANQEGQSFSELKNNGEYLRINYNFYKNQGEDTLDYQIEGAEIYRVYWTGVNKPIYELVTDKYVSTSVFPPTGSANYTARVYATNEEGKKVYSDFSEIVTVIRTPEIEVSEIIDGKIEITIVNADQYWEPFSFNVYKWDSVDGEVILDTFDISDDNKIKIDVTEDMEIYVRAYDLDYTQDSKPEYKYVYSAKSNIITIK